MTRLTDPAQHDDFWASLQGIAPVIPVIAIDRLEDAIPLCRALVQGGIKILEITLRTKHGLKAISEVKAAVPEAIVGVGTVITPEQIEQSLSAGAEFIVTPGATPALLDALISSGAPFLPGVATLSEIMLGVERGLSRFKFFPAEVAGGIPALKAFGGPLPQVRFCPTGGVKPANLKDYLAQKNVMAVGGTWLTPDELIQRKAWNEIEDLAKQAAIMCGF